MSNSGSNTVWHHATVTRTRREAFYRRARAGEVKEFTGISSPYEVPQNPELVVNTGELPLEAARRALRRAMSRFAVPPAPTFTKS